MMVLDEFDIVKYQKKEVGTRELYSRPLVLARGWEFFYYIIQRVILWKRER